MMMLPEEYLRHGKIAVGMLFVGVLLLGLRYARGCSIARKGVEANIDLRKAVGARIDWRQRRKRRGLLVQILAAVYAMEFLALTFLFTSLAEAGGEFKVESVAGLEGAVSWLGLGLYSAPTGLLAAVMWTVFADDEDRRNLAVVLHDIVALSCILVVIAAPAVVAVIYETARAASN